MANNKEKNSKFYEEVNLARGIGVLLVLLGHSFPQTGAEHPICNFIHTFLYSFHMPLFFVISGFVFTPWFIRTNSLKASIDVIWIKFKRLMIPYLFYSITTLLLKMIFSAYAYNQFELTDFYMILIGKNPNGGIWFLWTLFVVSSIIILCNKINIYILFIISLLLNLCMGFIPDDLVYAQRISHYLVYFCIGMLVHLNYYKIANLLYKKRVVGVGCLILIGLLQYFSITNPITVLFVGLLGSLTVWIFSINILNEESAIYKLISVFAKYGMDVYLLSYFIQVPIRVIGINFLSIPYLLCVILMFIFGGIIPIILSKLLIRKNKILNSVFIGSY